MANKFFKNSLSLCLLFIFHQTILCAQNSGDENFYNIMPPEVASLGKFGSFPVSYYTGTPNISIPLYSFPSRDHQIDISLIYDASGFIPNKEPGEVGLNWSLMAGGVITRNINNVPDDRNRPDLAGSTLIPNDKGFIYGIQSGLPLRNKEDIRTLSFLSFYQGAPIADLDYEYCPDVFSFNFGDYHGQFFMGNDGEIKVVSDKPLKIDVSLMSGQTNLALSLQNSLISITTERGDVYEFGGSMNTLDINFPYAINDQFSSNPSISGANGSINAWHLSRIISSRGNVVEFVYETQDPADFSHSETLDGIPASVDYAYEKIYENDRLEISESESQGSNDPGLDQRLFRSLVKKTYLSEIISDFGTVHFFYSAKTDNFYGSSVTNFNSNKAKNLVQITVQNALNKPIRSIDFSYTSYGSSSKGYRDFLTGLSIGNGSDFSSYSFDYYKTNVLPAPLTRGIDIWGFYNGRDENTALIPAVSSGSPDYTINWSAPGYYRLADKNYCDVGLLHHITYPTGGNTEFVYEGNSYSKILRKSVSGGMTPDVIEEDGTAGGARIKKITESSGIEKEFKYLINYENGSTNLNSSGIAIDPQVYFLDLVYYFGGPGNERFVEIEDNGLSGSRYSVPSIGYSEVTEITNLNGYTKYYFSSHLSNPDKYSLGVDAIKFRPDPDNTLSNFIQQLKRLAWPSSCEIERGRLIKTEVFDENNGILRSVERNYNENTLRYNNSSIGFFVPFSRSGFSFVNSFALYYFQNQVTQEEETLYQSVGNNIVVTNNFVYDANGNLREKSVQNSTDRVLITHYTYPQDYPINSSPPPSPPILAWDVSREMADRNIVGYPIETIHAILENNSERVVGAQLQTFHADPLTDIISPLGTSNLETTGPIDDFDPSSVEVQTINKSGMVYKSEYLQMDGRYTEKISYDNYDTKGNLLQYHLQSGEIRSALWGYNNIYPIAEVTNAQNSITASVTPVPQNGSVLLPSGSSGVSTSFTTETEGNITITAQGDPGNEYTIRYELTGPVGSSGYLCASRHTLNTCFYLESKFLSDMPAGTYTLHVYPYSGNGYRSISYDYLGAQTVLTGVRNFYHTSFEETDGNSTSGDAITGKYSRAGGYATTLANLTAGSYILSYWKKQGTEWEYHESTVVVSGTSYNLSLSGQIDEVRFYPADAQMTTYTYEPLVGMTSKCDENNRITYYEYDDFGRLSMIRDHDRNIIKRICYNYAGQAEKCPGEVYLNIEKSNTFTRNNCPQDATGGGVTYIVPAGTYSSMISQEDADQQAQNDVDANGQAYANANGTCTFYNVIKSGVFTRNNCPAGYTPGSVTYTVAANTYSSLVSQAAADQQAQDDVDTNGQAYANTNGTCTAPSVSCPFTVSSGFSSPFSSVSKTGNNVSFTIVFYPTSSPMYMSYSYTIGQIGADCRPSQVKAFSFSASGRNFQANIYSNGFVMVWITNGGDMPAYQSVSFSGNYTTN